MSEEYRPKLAYLPGAVHSPRIVLNRTLDKVDHIQAVAVVFIWNNGEYAADWSQMKVSELCLAQLVLDDSVRRCYLRGENRVEDGK